MGLEARPASRTALDSNLIPMEAPAQWSAKPYIEEIRAAGPKFVENFDRAMTTIAPKQLDVVRRFVAEQGWTAAPYYEPMMKALATGGLAKLEELVKAGVVPVVVFGSVKSLFQPPADSASVPASAPPA